MTAIKNYLTGLLLIAVSLFFFVLSYQVTQVGKHLSDTLMTLSDNVQSLNKTSDNINIAIKDMDTMVIGLNKPKTGTISVLNADLGAVRLAIDNVNQVALKERFFLERTQPEEVAKLNAVADTANDTIRQVQPVLASATNELLALQTATHSIDALVSDPQLTQTMANVNSTTKHLDATAADVQQTVHSYTHPTWAHKIFSWTLDVAHALNPL